MKRTAHLLIVATVALAACKTPPAPPPGTTPPATPTPGVLPPVPATPQPAPAPGPVVPPSPAAQQQAQKHAQLAAELLQDAGVDQARVELKNALNLDPQNRLALSLTRQLDADPVATLGRESFPYTVRPSDTMSKIAGRFLGDVYSFYILARYNGIKYPRQLASGQVIRIPGKAPPPSATPPEASPPPAAPPPREPAAPSPPGPTQEELAQLVARYSADARAALARQDLDGSIDNWQHVLDLDPKNSTAQLELQRVRGLKEKLQSVH